MNVKMIGSGAMFSKDNSACYLIDDKILVDTPNGTLKAILRLGYNIDNLECVLITHFHGDHFFDLPFVLLSLFDKRKDNNSKKLYIICNKIQETEIKKIIELSNFRNFDMFLSTLNIEIVGLDKENNTYNISDKYVIQSIPVEHSEGALGYVLKDKINNKEVGFTGDSKLCDGVEEIVSKSDVAFCDMSDIIGDEKSHMGINNIKYLLSKNLNKKIVTTHMREDTKEEVLKLSISNLIVGKDGLEINI